MAYWYSTRSGSLNGFLHPCTFKVQSSFFFVPSSASLPSLFSLCPVRLVQSVCNTGPSSACSCWLLRECAGERKKAGELVHSPRCTSATVLHPRATLSGRHFHLFFKKKRKERLPQTTTFMLNQSICCAHTSMFKGAPEEVFGLVTRSPD